MWARTEKLRLPWTEAGAARRRLGRIGTGWPVHTFGFRLCQLAGWKLVPFYLFLSRGLIFAHVALLYFRTPYAIAAGSLLHVVVVGYAGAIDVRPCLTSCALVVRRGIARLLPQ